MIIEKNTEGEKAEMAHDCFNKTHRIYTIGKVVYDAQRAIGASKRKDMEGEGWRK